MGSVATEIEEKKSILRRVKKLFSILISRQSVAKEIIGHIGALRLSEQWDTPYTKNMRFIAKLLLTLEFLAKLKRKENKKIVIIGCGHFSFGTTSYYLRKNLGSVLHGCYDINHNAARSFAEFYDIPVIYEDESDIWQDKEIDVIYVISNHHSHTFYAVKALDANIDVFIEKPISVTFEQFHQLARAVQHSKASVYCGYNRPLSKNIRDLRQQLDNELTTKDNPVTLNCFISSLVISRDHWYRNPQEGTRINGNLCHWIDFAVHILAWRGFPETLLITLVCSNEKEPDDNLTLVIASEMHDLITLTLTSRTQPPEGIEETINLEFRNVIAKIYNFKAIDVFCGQTKTYKQLDGDTGHEIGVLQPFRADITRPWEEIELSTLLSIRITHMLVNKIYQYEFSIADERAQCKNIEQQTATWIQR